MTAAEPTLIAPSQGTIGLPRERLSQLRALAEKRGTTIVGVIEDHIAQAIADGEIPDMIDGFGAEKVDFGRIEITVRGIALPPVGRQRAKSIAMVLDAAAGKPYVPTEPTQFGFEMQPDKLVPIVLDEVHKQPATIAFMRHGKAVMFSHRDDITDHVTKTSFPPSIALDLARMIRAAI